MLGGFNELLVSTIKQPRHLSPDQRSGAHRYGCLILVGNQNRPHPIFAYQEPAFEPCKCRNIKRMSAQDIECLIEVRMAGFFPHGGFPVCEDS